jgi:hypothetical protein
VATTVRSETVRSGTITSDQAVLDGRLLDGQEDPGGGPALVAAAVVANAAWGSTATKVVSGTGRRGKVAVSSAGTGQADSATLTITFPGGAYAVAPVAFVRHSAGTNLGFYVVSVSTTVLVIGVTVLPVTANTYTVEFVLLPV